MPYGTMTPFLLSKFVGGPGGVTTFTQLYDLPMWFGLFIADPRPSATPAALEVGGPLYHRPVASWETFGLTGLVNDIDIEFIGLPVDTNANAIGLWDAEVNGNLLAGDLFPEGAGVDLALGGRWILPAGEFFLGFDLTGL